MRKLCNAQTKNSVLRALAARQRRGGLTLAAAICAVRGVASFAAANRSSQKAPGLRILLPALQGRVARDARRRFAHCAKCGRNCDVQNLPSRPVRAGQHSLECVLCAAACGGISARSAAGSFVVVYGGTPVVCGFMAAWVLLAALPCLRRGPSQWDGKE